MLIQQPENMNFDKNKIINVFGLKKFGGKGWYSGNSLKCKECSRSDKFGINFELDRVHCFYDDYKTNIKSYLKGIGRGDLLGEESLSIDLNFKSFNKIIENIEVCQLPIKSLPIGFKNIYQDDYLDSRGFLREHYELFAVGETRLVPELKNHLIFQIFDKGGRRVAWLSRSKHSKEWHKANLEAYKMGDAELMLRYNNSPNTDFGKILGGENEITLDTRILILVEGIMDKVGVDSKMKLIDREDIKCLFTFGNSITDDQLRLLKEYDQIEEIYLLYDNGTLQQSKHYGNVLFNELKKVIKVCEIRQKDKDPGDLTMIELLDVLEKSVDPFGFNFEKIYGFA
jgi:hypothetical protein